MTGVAPRSDDLRLARVHLRCGMYAHARVELETLAGADRLDRDGILDLAEVRWRTGDLAGAAVAAAAWLEDGDEPSAGGALAHAISAEAAADRGGVARAAVHVEAAAALLGDRGALEALLAGILPRAAWPWDAEGPVDAGEPVQAEEPAETIPGPLGVVSLAPWPGADRPAPWPGAAPGGDLESAPGAVPPAPAPGAAMEPAPRAWVGDGASGTGGAAAAVSAAGPDAGPPAPAGVRVSRSAAELVRAGTPLLAIAPERAAILLALALRADRAAAEAVLAVLDSVPATAEPTPGARLPGGAPGVDEPAPGHGEPAPGGPAPEAVAALAFVRAEALRAAGRHEESRNAYASAERLALAPAEAGLPGSTQ